MMETWWLEGVEPSRMLQIKANAKQFQEPPSPSNFHQNSNGI